MRLAALILLLAPAAGAESLLEGLLPALREFPVLAVEADACRGLRVDELAQRCAGQAGADAPLLQAKWERREVCRKYDIKIARKTVRREIPALYEIGTEKGLVRIAQRVHFTGLESKGLADARGMFRQVMARIRPDIEYFFARQGIRYDLSYTLAGEEPAPSGPHSRVELKPWPCVSTSAKWCLMGIEHESGSGRYWYENPLEPANPGKFTGLVIHELAHLMGFRDNYVNTKAYCKAIYGAEGVNSRLSVTVPCLASLGSSQYLRMCVDIMAEEPFFFAGAGDHVPDDPDHPRRFWQFRSEDVVDLFRPLCPNLCSTP